MSNFDMIQKLKELDVEVGKIMYVVGVHPGQDLGSTELSVIPVKIMTLTVENHNLGGVKCYFRLFDEVVLPRGISTAIFNINQIDKDIFYTEIDASSYLSKIRANLFVLSAVQVWNGQYQCPTCKRLFGNVSDITQDHIRKWARCPHCDQCLDWSIFYARKSVRNSISKIFKVPEEYV